MTAEAAIMKYFDGFGIPAYTETSVPDDVTFPYLTHSIPSGGWGAGEVSGTVNVYYYTTSDSEVNAKSREIANDLGISGKIITCDDGAVWLKRGSPFSQLVRDDTDNSIKRRYINIDAEFLTMR